MAEKKDLSKAKPALMDRLKNLECKELEDNDLVQRILENENSRCLTYELGGEPIRIVAAFPRAVRHFYEQQRKRPKDTPMEWADIEADGYKVMAQLCLDAPFNTEKFWEYYDTKTGKFWGVFNKIYEGIEKSEEKIGEFRKK